MHGLRNSFQLLTIILVLFCLFLLFVCLHSFYQITLTFSIEHCFSFSFFIRMMSLHTGITSVFVHVPHTFFSVYFPFRLCPGQSGRYGYGCVWVRACEYNVCAFVWSSMMMMSVHRMTEPMFAFFFTRNYLICCRNNKDANDSGYENFFFFSELRNSYFLSV